MCLSENKLSIFDFRFSKILPMVNFANKIIALYEKKCDNIETAERFFLLLFFTMAKTAN